MPKGWQHLTWRAGLWAASGSLWTRLVQRQHREFSVALLTMGTSYFGIARFTRRFSLTILRLRLLECRLEGQIAVLQHGQLPDPVREAGFFERELMVSHAEA